MTKPLQPCPHPGVKWCGTITGYQYHRCRGGFCAMASRQRMRDYRTSIRKPRRPAELPKSHDDMVDEFLAVLHGYY